MEFLQKLVLIWQKISLVQRVLLAAVVLAAVLIGTLLVHWAQHAGHADALPGSAAGRGVQDHGEDRTRRRSPTSCATAAPRSTSPGNTSTSSGWTWPRRGCPSAEQNGYKLFDDEKIGISPFVQNVNLKRALQDELAKSIQMIDGVAHARVHIVSPEQKLFASDEEQTTASVVLRLQPGYRLSGTNIAAITHLVSGSVKGLKAGERHDHRQRRTAALGQGRFDPGLRRQHRPRLQGARRAGSRPQGRGHADDRPRARAGPPSRSAP